MNALTAVQVDHSAKVADRHKLWADDALWDDPRVPHQEV
jgi:hypothetical protein